MKLGGPSNGKSRKKKSRTIQSLIMETPTPPIDHINGSGDTILSHEEGMNAFLDNDIASQMEVANNGSNDFIPNDEVENNDALGGMSTLNGSSDHPGSVYVLPPHLRRSARTSRSKYRKSSLGTSPIEPGPSEPVNQDSDDDDSEEDDHNVNEAVRAFVSKGRGPTTPDSCRPRPGEDPYVVYWVNGAPVGGKAQAFADYCGLEAKVYHRFPLHKRWGKSQKINARLIFTTAQLEKHYIFLGAEDVNNKGQFLPPDQRAAEKFLDRAINHMVRDWRHTVKRNYYDIWEQSDDEMKKSIERGLDPRIPLDEWPTLCRYYGSPAKKAESERNRMNRRSTKPKPICTLGRTSLQMHYYEMEKELGEDFTYARGFASGHKVRKTGAYPDEVTRDFCEKVQELEKTAPTTRQRGCSSLIPVLDKVKGKSHGGFEIGMGRGYTRRFMQDIESSKIIGAPADHEKEEELRRKEEGLRRKEEELRRKEEELKRKEEELKRMEDAQQQERNQVDPLSAMFSAQSGGRLNSPFNLQGGHTTNNSQRGQSSGGRAQDAIQIDPITLMAMMAPFYGQNGGQFNIPFNSNGHVARSAQSGQSNGNGFDVGNNLDNGSF